MSKGLTSGQAAAWRLTALAAGVVLLVGSALAARADDDGGAEAPAAPALFRVSDADSSVYLFGSFSQIASDAPWRSRALAGAIDQSEVIFLEAPVGEPAAQQAAEQIFATEGKLAEGRSLQGLIEPSQGEALAGIAASIGMPVQSLDALKPWAAFVVLSSQIGAPARADAEQPAPESVDAAIRREAAARGRRVRYFASIEEALGVLTGMPERTQTALLASLIDDWSRQNDGVAAAYEAWRTGDAAATDAYLNAAMREGAPAAYERLVTARIADLADGVATALAARETVLFAINAGYLVGDGALPAVLSSRGFTVEEIGAPAGRAAPAPALSDD